MSFSSARIPVPATTPSSLMTTDRVQGVGVVGQSLLISNPDSAYTVYLGGSTVTSATGYPLAPLEKVAVDAGTGETLYAVATTSSVTVSVLYQGV